MAEFGGSLVDEYVDADASRLEAGPEIPAGTTEDRTELEEC